MLRLHQLVQRHGQRVGVSVSANTGNRIRTSVSRTRTHISRTLSSTSLSRLQHGSTLSRPSSHTHDAVQKRAFTTTRSTLSMTSSAASHASQSAASTTATATSTPIATVNAPLNWPIGDEVDGFRVVERTPIAAFNCVVYKLVDAVSASGATLYHVSRDDPNCAWGVAFRTPVNDDTGVAHVLEHVVLCGSKRFPVRDPFFLLLRRSLQTYMNAMTAQDWTLYPFASMLEKDRRNLFTVYLDAVFDPLIREEDFRQEGHRWEVSTKSRAEEEEDMEEMEEGSEEEEELDEHEEEDNDDDKSADPTSSLRLTGVVLNEMKGAMSDSASQFGDRLQRELFPALKDTPVNPNHFNSGGDPPHIPDLTVEKVREFHAKNYRVDNALFVSYGDAPPPTDMIRERVQLELEKQQQQKRQSGSAPSSSLAPSSPASYQPQQRYTSPPPTVYATCAPDPMVADAHKLSKVCAGVLCKPLGQDGSDAATTHADADAIAVESLGLSILSSLLLDGPSAPMHVALLSSHLGSSYAPSTGYDASTREPSFAIGAEGVARENEQKVVDVVMDTLRKSADEGFPEERIDAIMKQIEISIKNVRSHFGVDVMCHMVPHWAFGMDPVSPLRLTAHLDAVRSKLAAGPFLQSLIRKHWLDNGHRITLIMRADVEHAKKNAELETKQTQERASKLTEAERKKVAEAAEKLAQEQDKRQDTAGCKLPTLTVEDINKKSEVVELLPLQLPTQQPSQKQTSSQSESPSSSSSRSRFVTLPLASNGLGYIRGLVPTSRLPLELRPYLPLYCYFLTELGAGSLDYKALSHQLDLHTGGVGASIECFAHLDNIQQHEEVVVVRGMALAREGAALMDLLHTVLHQPRFESCDLPRLMHLLLNSANSAGNSLHSAGSSHAAGDAAAHCSPAAHASEQYGGITHVTFITNLAREVMEAGGTETETGKAKLREIGHKIAQVATILMQNGLERVMLVGDEAALTPLQNNLPTLMGASSSTQLNNLPPPSPTTPIRFPWQPAASPAKTFYALPQQVNHVSLVLPTVAYTHPDAAKLDVLARLMSSVYVHREVREKGGAYGGSVSHSADGFMCFSSYQDPESVRTLQAFYSAPEWVLGSDGHNMTSSDVEEALLATFASIDQPKTPDTKGLAQFIFGVTQEQRQTYRDRLLSVTKKDVIDVCQRYLTPATMQSAHATIVGDESNISNDIINNKVWKVKKLNIAPTADAMEEEEEED